MICRDCPSQSEPLPPCRQGWLWVGCAVAWKSPRCKLTVRTCLVNAARAFWQCLWIRFSVFCVVVAGMSFLAGCKAQPAYYTLHPKLPPVDSVPLMAGQMGKDAAITSEAAKIDAIAPQAKEHTDAQRAAIAANPASNILSLVAEYEARIKAHEDAEKDSSKIIDGLKKEKADLGAQLEKVNARTDQIIRLSLAGFGALLVAGGVIVAFMAAKAGSIFFGVGPMQAGSISLAGGSLIFSSFAYGWALRNQGIVMGIFGAFIIAAVVFWIANRRNEKST